MKTAKISCPGAAYDKNERIKGLLDSCFEWMCSEPLRKLIELFGGNIMPCESVDDRAAYMEHLHDFAARWDYRNGRERWAVGDDGTVTDNPDLVMDQVKALGLLDESPPACEPDYILVPGGAGRSNHTRPLLAKRVIDEYGYTDRIIIALSGMRPIDEAERRAVDEYAKGARTEYEAICTSFESVFSLSGFTEQISDNENINLCSAVRKYDRRYKDSEVYSLAAPSTDPKRRANSYDTFEFMLSHFKVGQGKKLLIVTSTIYVPFQYLKFMKQAIAGGFEVDCIGTKIPGVKPTACLQEIKGTIDAIYGLYHEWCSVM